MQFIVVVISSITYQYQYGKYTICIVVYDPLSILLSSYLLIDLAGVYYASVIKCISIVCLSIHYVGLLFINDVLP